MSGPSTSSDTDRHPDLQRQQQLRDGLDSALHGQAVQSRGTSPTARMALGFEKMEKGSLGMKYTDRVEPHGQALQGDDGQARLREGAAGAADVRQRRPRAHGEVRHHGRAVRQDRLEEPQALGEQPLLAVPGRVLARGHPERADGLRAAHQAAVLPHLRRLRLPRSWPARPS